MPFTIVRNDITRMQVDAIVNTANPKPVIGTGTDSAIHEKAGPELLAARQTIGTIAPGDAAVTPAFKLDAKYVIHTVGPAWHGGLLGEGKKLRSCYMKSLALAAEHGCGSIAFPLISTGNYGFPKDKALQIAIAAFSDFLLHHEMEVYLVVYDGESYQLSEKLFQKVASYIDQNYIASHAVEISEAYRERTFRRVVDRTCDSKEMLRPLACAPAPKSQAPRRESLASMLSRMDAGFTETLLTLIDRTGKKDSEIYKKANLSKQHFSKIRNDPDYKPKKPTAIALALALELDLEQTNELIGRAGFVLSSSSKFDLIIRYFIENKNYNVIEINLALYEFDQPLLGA